MGRITLFLSLLFLTTACGKKRHNCDNVLCPSPLLFSVQIVDSQGRSLESNTQLSRYYNSLIVKSYNYQNTTDTVSPSIDQQGVIQFNMKSSSLYIFQYNAVEADTFHLYQIIPLVATSNPCCATYGMWSVMVRDSTYANYQGQVIKVKK